MTNADLVVIASNRTFQLRVKHIKKMSLTSTYCFWIPGARAKRSMKIARRSANAPAATTEADGTIIRIAADRSAPDKTTAGARPVPRPPASKGR